MNALKQAAREYAEGGLPVVPMHTESEGACSCVRGADCGTPGKHPRILWKDRPAEPPSGEEIDHWWGMWPEAPVGCIIGDRFAVVDVDEREAVSGLDALHELEREYSELPETWRALTPSGGVHIILARNGHRLSGNGTHIAPNVELRYGRQILRLPPGSGREWETGPDERQLAELPAWVAVLASSTSPNADGPVSVPEMIPAGERHPTLKRLAASLRRRGLRYHAIFAALHETNERQCEPPKPAEEIEDLARWADALEGGSILRAERGTEEPGLTSQVSHPPIGTRAREWPAALGGDAYHGVAGDLAHRLAPESEADPAALLTHTLILAGNMVGRYAHYKIGRAWHHANDYLLVIGETGEGGKGTALTDSRAVFELVDQTWAANQIKSGSSTGEGLIHHLRDPSYGKDGEIDDPGVEDKRVVILEEEFASVLRRMADKGNTLSHVMRTFWDRGSAQTLTKNQPEKATGAHPSYVGHITPAELRRELTEVDVANGFLNRFLLVCVKRSQDLPFGGEVGDDVLAALATRVAAAVEFAKNQRHIAMDTGAKQLWRERYRGLRTRPPGLYGAATSRGATHVMRLAMIYALLDQARVINEQHLRAALEVWRYCDDSAWHVFGERVGDSLADKLLTALRRAGDAGLTRSVIRDDVVRSNNVPAERIDRALMLLVDYGVIRRHTDPSSGGRPAERWVYGAAPGEPLGSMGGMERSRDHHRTYLPFLPTSHRDSPRALPRGDFVTSIGEVVDALEGRGDEWNIEIVEDRAVVIVKARQTFRGESGVQTFDLGAWRDANARDIAQALALIEPEARDE